LLEARHALLELLEILNIVQRRSAERYAAFPTPSFSTNSRHIHLDLLELIHTPRLDLTPRSAVALHEIPAARVPLHADSTRRGLLRPHMGLLARGLTTRALALVDGDGMPLKIGLTAGERHDNTWRAT
jgi:hypothetical protein